MTLRHRSRPVREETEVEKLIALVASRTGWKVHAPESCPGVTVEYRKPGYGFIRIKLKQGQVFQVTTRKRYLNPHEDTVMDYLRRERP